MWISGGFRLYSSLLFIFQGTFRRSPLVKLHKRPWFFIVLMYLSSINQQLGPTDFDKMWIRGLLFMYPELTTMALLWVVIYIIKFDFFDDKCNNNILSYEHYLCCLKYKAVESYDSSRLIKVVLVARL